MSERERLINNILALQKEMSIPRCTILNDYGATVFGFSQMTIKGLNDILDDVIKYLKGESNSAY